METEICRGLADRFSSCYGQDSTQEDIYDNDVKPLLDVLYNGVVSASFAGFVAIHQNVNFDVPAQRP